MDINFELYKVFYYVAKTLSFSEASANLFISQSAVSQSVKILEEKLQCKLFIRNTKQVKLTSEGELLFKHVEQAFNFIKAGERNLSDLGSMKQGEVKIGASDTICKYYLMPYFKKYNALYPKVKLKITNRPSPKCIELLENGSVDVIIVNIPEKMSDKTLAVKKLRMIEDVFVAGNSFRFLEGKQVSLKELTQYPLLMLEKNTSSRSFIDSIMKKKGIKLLPEVELGSVDLLVEFAKIGLGISFIVRDYIERELSKGELFEINIKDKLPERSLGIMTNKSIPITSAAKKFVDLMV